MKRLKFEEIWLLSQSEKKARMETLSNDVTAVVAPNEFGKSSLIKSLYAALGAEPNKNPESWVQAKVISLLKFSIDDVSYFILRHGSIFALFDESRKRLWNANGITKGLAPQLNPMLDFNIKLLNKSNELTAPVPALCFMPFYVDQDKGWTDIWESFSGTGMFSNYKTDIANFHAGIRPKEYYIAKSEKSEGSTRLTELRQDRNALARAEVRIKKKRTSIGITFDPETFADRITNLLAEQNALQAQFDVVKGRVSELQSFRSMAINEMEIAKKVLSELDADFKFLEKIEDPEIHCPICNTMHKNDFANRYGLLSDADACRTVYSESLMRSNDYGARIEKELRQINGVQDRIERIGAILDEVRGEVKLRDILNDESERMIDEAFVIESDDINARIGEIDALIAAAEAKMKEFDKVARKNEIRDFYAKRMAEFCNELGVSNIPVGVLKSVRPTINEAGSSQPRLLLAYYFAILHTIAKYSTAFFGPIVIDTPKQQDQDDRNAEAMIRFCIERKPAGSQLILASGSLHGVNVPGHTIQPDQQHSLLSSKQFDAVKKFIVPFLNAALE